MPKKNEIDILFHTNQRESTNDDNDYKLQLQ